MQSLGLVVWGSAPELPGCPWGGQSPLWAGPGAKEYCESRDAPSWAVPWLVFSGSGAPMGTANPELWCETRSDSTEGVLEPPAGSSISRAYLPHPTWQQPWRKRGTQPWGPGSSRLGHRTLTVRPDSGLRTLRGDPARRCSGSGTLRPRAGRRTAGLLHQQQFQPRSPRDPIPAQPHYRRARAVAPHPDRWVSQRPQPITTVRRSRNSCGSAEIRAGACAGRGQHRCEQAGPEQKNWYGKELEPKLNLSYPQV